MATVISHKIKQIIIKSNILKNEKDLPRLNIMEQLYTIVLKRAILCVWIGNHLGVCFRFISFTFVVC